MIEEISDNKLLYAFRQLLDSSPDDRQRFKSTYWCGSQSIRQVGLEPGVFLLKNNRSARYAGVMTCKSAWLCPVCSARVMSKYASDIAAAIDALMVASDKQIAAMFTFTIPHTSGMTCTETTEILFATWKDFIVHGNKTIKANNKKGRDKRWQMYDPFAKFCESFGCRYRVRVGEYTWGKSGWHPHFHCLFWVDADKFKNVKAAEAELNARWLELAKRNTLKMWNKLYPTKREKNAIRLEAMYNNLNDESQGLYISKDKDGNVIKQESSWYICGWGADKELTGNIQNKASQEGHFTPRQLLEKYSQGDEHAGELYLEYCRATRIKLHRRIMFSKGLRNIIAKHKLTKIYQEAYKKKATAEVAANGIWRQVCWFKSHQWRDVCIVENMTKTPIRYQLLKLALEDNGRKLIEDFLLSFNIDIRNNSQHGRVDIYADTFKFVPAA